MTVYADILVVLNVIVDYFLIKLTSKLIHKSPSLARLLAGAFIGGISSLYIFIPQPAIWLDIIAKTAISALVTLTVFGYRNKTAYLRALLCFSAVTFFYAGAMIAVWYIFKPYGMLINNSVVYFNISPVMLIAFSVICYFITAVLRYFTERNAKTARRCKVTVTMDGKSVDLSAMIDSGNSLCDSFGMSEVIITDKKVIENLFGNCDINSRYRVLPCKTVSGSSLLEGYRCDSAVITAEGASVKISKPILAVSKTNLSDECDAIINPESII